MDTRVIVRDDRIVVVIETSPRFKAMPLPEQRRMVEEAFVDALGQLTTATGDELAVDPSATPATVAA